MSGKNLIKILFILIVSILIFECLSTDGNAINRTALNISPLKNRLNADEFLIKGFENARNFINKNPLYFAKTVSANFNDMPQKSEITQKNIITEIPDKNISVPISKTIPATSGNVNIAKTLSVKNQTSYTINKELLTDNGIPFTIGQSQSPQILIIHTHGTESYTPSEKYTFTYTENTRTTDTNYNVVRIGSELADILKNHGLNVVHDVTMYDYPDYNASYDKAYYGISAMLKKYPSIQIVLDIHRDAVNTDTGETVKLVGEVNGEKAAQIMFVVGTDECGFSHPNWEYNLKFASMLQNRLYNINPSLVRPINLRTSRFNQHFTKGSLIVEVGTNGNTLDEALVSSKYLAEAIVNTQDIMQ